MYHDPFYGLILMLDVGALICFVAGGIAVIRQYSARLK
jgi:hypothetical protein